jgi:chemotaxis regulatin CheY-phosphate phosphatase CheZ
MGRTHDITISGFDLDRIEAEAREYKARWNKACDEQGWLMLEVDSWRYRAEAATGILSRWMEWARAHGHLEHAAGIVTDTRDILSNVSRQESPGKLGSTGESK